MDRFHPDDGEQIAARMKGGATVDDAVASIRRDNLVTAVEEFRHTGDRDLLADILLAILRTRP